MRDDPDRSDVDMESHERNVRGKGGRDRTVTISHGRRAAEPVPESKVPHALEWGSVSW